MSSIKCLNFKFCSIKYKFINRIVNNIRFELNLTYMLKTLKIKTKKNMQSNYKIFKICSHINFFSKHCNLDSDSLDFLGYSTNRFP